MLNITSNTIKDKINTSLYPALQGTLDRTTNKVFLKTLAAFFFIFLVILLMPWTQNIRAKGNVTALKPDQRPQTIHSIIPGRIEKWFVQEGDFVKKGDTILFISEVKDEYFDPGLLGRTQDQLTAKEMSVSAYMEKVKALDTQIRALVQNRLLRLEQAENKLLQAKLKVTSDSIDYEAAIINYSIAEKQYTRFEELYKEGLKSLTDLENRKLTLQRQLAAKISAENKLLTSRNEVINAKVEINSTDAKFRDDIAKAESEKYTAMSNMYEAEISVTKMQNQYTNYSIRIGNYYITAPQDGYITKTIQTGLGETIKEGEQILSIMPFNYDLAVETYIKPIDFPLLEKGQPVRIQFDGWPAIIFSGWPNTSYGTYGGRVYAIDNFISDNGLYRILVVPDPEDHPWPDALRVGAGTNSMLLLKEVQVWYELWRKINGFPPDYYKPVNNVNTSNK